MKKISIVLGVVLFLTAGCVGVQVKAPEKPIKVDIAMRLDIYQHVQQDIDAIESIVTGSDKTGIVQSFFDSITPSAYAQGIDPRIEQAALRRRGRYNEIVSLQKQGVLGESVSGTLSIRKGANASVDDLVSQENSDRMIIYSGIAKNNGTTAEAVQIIYAERLQNDAPAGTPIEISPGNWHTK